MERRVRRAASESSMLTLYRWSCIPVHEVERDRWVGRVPRDFGGAGVGVGLALFVAVAGCACVWYAGDADPWSRAGALGLGACSAVGLWLAWASWRSRGQLREVALANDVVTVDDVGPSGADRWSAPTSAFVGVVLRVDAGELPAHSREFVELRHAIDDRTICLYTGRGNGMGAVPRGLALRLAERFGVEAWVQTGDALERLERNAG